MTEGISIKKYANLGVFCYIIRVSRELRKVVLCEYTTLLRPFGDENLPKGKFCLNIPRLHELCNISANFDVF